MFCFLFVLFFVCFVCFVCFVLLCFACFVCFVVCLFVCLLACLLVCVCVCLFVCFSAFLLACLFVYGNKNEEFLTEDSLLTNLFGCNSFLSQINSPNALMMVFCVLSFWFEVPTGQTRLGRNPGVEPVSNELIEGKLGRKPRSLNAFTVKYTRFLHSPPVS